MSYPDSGVSVEPPGGIDIFSEESREDAVPKNQGEDNEKRAEDVESASKDESKGSDETVSSENLESRATPDPFNTSEEFEAAFMDMYRNIGKHVYGGDEVISQNAIIGTNFTTHWEDKLPLEWRIKYSAIILRHPVVFSPM